jgi:hypothetical protein
MYLNLFLNYVCYYTGKRTKPQSNLSKRKRKREDENTAIERPSKQRRFTRRGSPAELALANILEDVWKAVNDHPDAGPFRFKVQTKDAPDYYDIIKDPIDLSTIRKVIIFTFSKRSLYCFSKKRNNEDISLSHSHILISSLFLKE